MLVIPALKRPRQDGYQFKASLGFSLDYFTSSKTLLERRTAGGWGVVGGKEEKGEKLMVSYRGNIPRINSFRDCSQNRARVGRIPAASW